MACDKILENKPRNFRLFSQKRRRRDYAPTAAARGATHLARIDQAEHDGHTPPREAGQGRCRAADYITPLSTLTMTAMGGGDWLRERRAISPDIGHVNECLSLNFGALTRASPMAAAPRYAAFGAFLHGCVPARRRYTFADSHAALVTSAFRMDFRAASLMNIFAPEMVGMMMAMLAPKEAILR